MDASRPASASDQKKRHSKIGAQIARQCIVYVAPFLIAGAKASEAYLAKPSIHAREKG